MNLELPHHLHATRDLLQASLRTNPTEQAPAMPQGLLEDLTRSASFEASTAHGFSMAEFFGGLRLMLASPAFGATAAAIMVLGIVSTMILRPDENSSTDTFRGSSAYSEAVAIQVVLIGAPAGMQADLEDSADFEDGLFSSAATTEATAGLKGARVLVDFTQRTITAINPKGEAVYQDQLPESSTGIAFAVASAVTQL